MTEAKNSTTKAHVIVALDSSEMSDKVLSWCKSNVFPFAGKITLLHSYGYSPLPLFPGAGAKYGLSAEGVNEQMRNEAMKKGEDFLKKAGKTCVDFGFRPDELKLLIDKPAASTKKAIHDYIAKAKPGILVVGSRGMGTIGRTFLGSTSDYLMHNCECTV
eukprot:CAMPEP_0114490636 /NCGR_PEP_ID=MMETSP0109-20121206/2552_1 /TAXON_ID=29199 /ORGANISM="Chlorarachnion reptans, Strain CCCM449" /LENGTH=159 /DNA_ID=CAMNT_0001667275 /DNA_START=21 /DNA_END=497 /DNA_ORIENTATION=-